MRFLVATNLLLALMVGCGSTSSQTKGCAKGAWQSPMMIEDGTATSDYSATVLLMSGSSRFGSMAKCSGTIVGHNSILTAAHCIKGPAGFIYAMRTSALSGSEHSTALNSAISPIKIISHGTIATSSSDIQISQLPDDLVILIFEDQSFDDYSVIIPSLFGIERPPQFASTVMVGFGKSSEQDNSDTSIKRMGSGFYLTEPSFGEGLVFSFNRALNQETLQAEGPKKYSQAQHGDSGGPLFYPSDSLLHIVGVLSGGGTSSDGLTSRSIYVDLYSQRSLSLLEQAKLNGAHFTLPTEGRPENPSASSGPEKSGSRCLR